MKPRLRLFTNYTLVGVYLVTLIGCGPVSTPLASPNKKQMNLDVDFSTVKALSEEDVFRWQTEWSNSRTIEGEELYTKIIGKIGTPTWETLLDKKTATWNASGSKLFMTLYFDSVERVDGVYIGYTY